MVHIALVMHNVVECHRNWTTKWNHVSKKNNVQAQAHLVIQILDIIRIYAKIGRFLLKNKATDMTMHKRKLSCHDDKLIYHMANHFKCKTTQNRVLWLVPGRSWQTSYITDRSVTAGKNEFYKFGWILSLKVLFCKRLKKVWNFSEWKGPRFLLSKKKLYFGKHNRNVK